MARSWTPSIVPKDVGGQNVYLVVDDFGRNGCIYREADVEAVDLETVIKDLISGQFNDPVRVVAFATFEHWADDVSEDVARKIQRQFDLAYDDVPSTVEAFVERHLGSDRQLNLRLA